MDRNDDSNIEITLDLSKLLGFQGLDARASETDFSKLLDDMHNKVGEIPPPNGDEVPQG